MTQTAIILLGGQWQRIYKAIDLINSGDLKDILLVLSVTPREEALCLTALDKNIVNLKENKYELYVNHEARDTVMNFTTTRNKILASKAKSLWIVTNACHMDRAMAIAKVIYKGTKVSLYRAIYECKCKKEPKIDLIIDVMRSIIWRATGLNLGGRREMPT